MKINFRFFLVHLIFCARHANFYLDYQWKSSKVTDSRLICVHSHSQSLQTNERFFRFNRNICIWLNCRVFFCRFCVELTYADHLNFLSNNYISIGKKNLTIDIRIFGSLSVNVNFQWKQWFAQSIIEMSSWMPKM